MKKYTILVLTTSLALASLGYYFYQKQRVKKLNERVTSLEDTLRELEELKKK